MKAEIIAIGTELLLGNIVNTNAAHLAEGLASVGIDTYRQTVVGDNPERLKEALEAAYEVADMVITSGGLGATGDDLSKETAAAYFGKKLVENETAKAHIREFMENLGRKLTENQWKQAMLPEGSIPLQNSNGTAPGFILEADGKTLIMLPGPPSEIVPMFDKQVIPYLREKSGEVLVSRTIHLAGIGEAAVESELHEEMLTMSNPTLAPYAKEGIIDLRITAKAQDTEQAYRMIAPVEQMIREKFGVCVLGADEDTMESVIVSLLKERGWKIATAESLTGGWVAGKIVSFPGASEVFEGGFVTYSNEAKMNLLGVKKETIDTYGVVSEETAGEMAKGAAEKLGCEVAVATTGIAGPGGGTEKTPVGTVCFGVYINGKIQTSTVRYTRNRNSNRDFSVIGALNRVRLEILNDNI